MNPRRYPLIALLVLALGALGTGCSTNLSNEATSVVLWKDGQKFVPSKTAYTHARKSLEALLAQQNLRLGENDGRSAFVSIIAVESTGIGGEFKPVKVVSATRMFKQYPTAPVSTAGYREPLAPLQAQVDKGFRDALWDMPVK